MLELVWRLTLTGIGLVSGMLLVETVPICDVTRTHDVAISMPLILQRPGSLI